VAFALLHDPAAARASLGQAEAAGMSDPVLLNQAVYWLDAQAGRWRTAIADGEKMRAATLAPSSRYSPHLESVEASALVIPLIAVANARAGELAAAHRVIDTTPGDCIACETARGNIDAIERNWSGATFWFSRAIHDAPSVPFAYFNWGAMLMAKGDFDGAIAKFASANQKGPHFADPLEMWGEALIAKNRSDLALARFVEANKYAPNWGRLHLKWGEAMLWSGDKLGAQKQFAVASNLDLTAAEKSQLAGVRV